MLDLCRNLIGQRRLANWAWLDAVLVATAAKRWKALTCASTVWRRWLHCMPGGVVQWVFRTVCLFLLVGLQWLCFLGTGSLRAAPADTTVADLLPSTTIIYVEGQGTDSLLQLPLVRSLMGSELYRELWRSPDVMKARGAITLAEVALGERLTETLARATSGGWVLAVDVRSEGIALLAQTADKHVCAELYAKLESIASQDAKSNNREFHQVTYRDAPAYKLGDATIIALDKWLLLTNKSDFGKNLVDNLASPPKESLSGHGPFATARAQQSKTEQPLIWSYVDLEQMRARGVAKDLFRRPDDNFAAELLLGGALSVLRHTPQLTGAVRATDQRLMLELSAPTPRAVKASDYEFFFGPNLTGAAPAPLPMQQSHATLAAYRDVSKLWRYAGDLFGQAVNDQLAQADATLTTLFSGRDFGEEILGAIEPGVQFIVAPHTSESSAEAQPKIKLPAFALLARLKDPDKMRPQLKRIFCSLVGFLNIAGAQEQQPQMDLDIQGEQAGKLVVTTRFVLDADRPADWAVPVQYNFTPTLILWDRYAVLSSNQNLAEQIIAASQAAPQPASSTAAPVNTLLHIDAPFVLQALAVNRDELVSQNMLEKGHTQEEAGQEIDTLLKIIDLVQSLEVSLSAQEQTSLNVELSIKP